MSSLRRVPPPGGPTTRRRVPTPTSLNHHNSSNNSTASARSGSQRKDLNLSTGSSKGDGNIQVVVRCRGVSPTEVRLDSKVVATVPTSRGTTVHLTDPSPALPSTSSATMTTASSAGPTGTANLPRSWDFGTRALADGTAKGNVYGPDAKQAMLYDEVAKPILEQVLEGYNCTIFAYGQTGTGKTYTMEGDLSPNGATFHDEAGIIPRTLYYLFDHLSKSAQEYTVKCSYVELYNEELRDLNARDDATAPTGGLRIYDEQPSSKSSASASSSSSSASSNSTSAATSSSGGSVRIEGLEETFITDAEEGLEVLRRGSMRRISASTNMNERSSRSHSIFTILVHSKDSPATPTSSSSAAASATSQSLLKVGKLNLVDLAGSENVARSGAVQGRAREAGRINVSLLALGRVINMLSGTSALDGEKKGHIPYRFESDTRESKLTRLLQDSLGGNTKTTIIATISPTSFEETASTLSYALQATSIQNRPEANRKIGKDVVLNQIMSEMSRVKTDLKAARGSEGYYVSRETLDELDLERQHYKTSSQQHVESLAELEILRSELQSTRDQLEQNVRALSKTKESLRLTKEDLGVSESSLEHTRRELELVKVENESLKCLTDAWEVSRKGWKEETEDALQDVQGLREKLARKSLVEEANLSMLSHASSFIATRTSEITAQTTKLRKAQSEFVWSIEARLAEYFKRQETKWQDDQSSIESMLTGVAKGLDVIVQRQTNTNGEWQQYREAIEQTCMRVYSRIEADARQLVREQAELEETLRNELDRHVQETSEHLEEIVQPIQQLHSECMARLAEDASLLSILSKQDAEALLAENAFLKHVVSELETAFETEQARQASEEATILARVQAELANATLRRQQAMRETFELVQQSMIQRGAERDAAASERSIAMQHLADDNSVVRNELEKAIERCEGAKAHGLEQSATSIDLVRQLVSSQASSAEQSRNRQLETLLNAASFVHETSKASRTSEAQASRQSHTAIRGLIAQTRDAFASWSVSSDSNRQDAQAITETALETVGNFANLAARAVSSVNICNDGLASELQADLQRRVRHDVPTGSTPRPKERPIDRMLPLIDLDSSDRPSVLETLLKARDADLAASLAADEQRNVEDGDDQPAVLGSMARSPSLEVVSLPPIGPRASSSFVTQVGKGEPMTRRSRVLGERDSNVLTTAPVHRKPLAKRPVKRSVV
ncbi:uncharacterized protein JCM15063_006073 [Sporobolomyces koalae]|uniref:uncharacterized protein n=1 Tax=Sporobolomyces koalae TaxID=500713 RepID=UPI00316B4776